MATVEELQADVNRLSTLLQAANEQLLTLAGQLETARASVTRWEVAYKSLAAEADKAGKEYGDEHKRLNALNVQLTRDLIDARNKVDMLSRGTLCYVEFFVDTYDVFSESALTPETNAKLLLARQLLAQSADIPL